MIVSSSSGRDSAIVSNWEYTKYENAMAARNSYETTVINSSGVRVRNPETKAQYFLRMILEKFLGDTLEADANDKAQGHVESEREKARAINAKQKVINTR
jgi:hypothetical protein